MKKSSLVFVIGVTLALNGCGLSTFTQRETDPFILDIFGNFGKPVKILVTDSSRRLVYEFKRPNRAHPVFCVDAQPDTSIAASGAVALDVSATVNGGAPGVDGNGALGMGRTSGASTLPLIRRSQGLQYGRDLEARECVLYATGITSESQYISRIDNIRQAAKQLIDLEIEKGLSNLSLQTSPNHSEPPELPARK